MAGEWLALETSTSLGSVAIGTEGNVLAEVMLGMELRHSEALLPAIAFLLERTGLARSDLAGVIVGGGPGSFTGVRIAAATAKGLVHALRIPLLSYSSLAVLAAGAAAGERAVCALFDARRGEVYAACYRFPEEGGIITELQPSALDVSQVLERTMSLDPLYVGEGAVKNADVIAAHGGKLAGKLLALPRSSSLLWLAHHAPEQGRVKEPSAWQPEYARPSGAERMLR